MNAEALNRRATVEQYLFDVYQGKKPLPTKDVCRALAMLLGVPNEYRDPRFDAILKGEQDGPMLEKEVGERPAK